MPCFVISGALTRMETKSTHQNASPDKLFLAIGALVLEICSKNDFRQKRVFREKLFLPFLKPKSAENRDAHKLKNEERIKMRLLINFS